MKKCPFCAEEIQDEAIKCRFCGELLEKKPQEQWYFKTSTLVIAFLCIGPFMLPLIWFNPHLGRDKKIIISIIILILSYFLIAIALKSFQSISNYYKIIFGNISEMR